MFVTGVKRAGLAVEGCRKANNGVKCSSVFTFNYLNLKNRVQTYLFNFHVSSDTIFITYFKTSFLGAYCYVSHPFTF
jgi:hypothetical protein